MKDVGTAWIPAVTPSSKAARTRLGVTFFKEEVARADLEAGRLREVPILRRPYAHWRIVITKDRAALWCKAPSMGGTPSSERDYIMAAGESAVKTRI